MSAEILHAEHQRLLARYESIVDSSFKDFSLLAALASIPAVFPVSKIFLEPDSSQHQQLILAWFLAALVIVTVIALRDLLKWCIAEPYLRRLIEIEHLLRRDCANVGDQGNRIATRIAHNRRNIYISQLRWFGGFGAVILFSPLFVLIFIGHCDGVKIYAMALSVCLGWYIMASQILKRRIVDQPNE